MSPPTSVILPTVRWTRACQEIAEQLDSNDELLVVCDDRSDEIAERMDELPDKTRLVFAGDPVGCSGKANAIASGMDAARHSHLVWTDDDFHHPPDWLDGLHADYDEHGPVSELPFFVGRDWLSVLLEPIYALGGTLGAYAGDEAWGGAVMFDRADLDEDAFLRDLRRTVSDDGLLSEYLDITPIKRVRRVEIGGTVRRTAERHVRFIHIVRRHEPRGAVSMVAIAALITAGCLLFPLYALLISTALIAGVYAMFGIHRWTALLAFPAMLLQVPLLGYGLARRTFVWSGRRYHWHSKFDVRVSE